MWDPPSCSSCGQPLLGDDAEFCPACVDVDAARDVQLELEQSGDQHRSVRSSDPSRAAWGHADTTGTEQGFDPTQAVWDHFSDDPSMRAWGVVGSSVDPQSAPQDHGRHDAQALSDERADPSSLPSPDSIASFVVLTGPDPPSVSSSDSAGQPAPELPTRDPLPPDRRHGHDKTTGSQQATPSSGPASTGSAAGHGAPQLARQNSRDVAQGQRVLERNVEAVHVFFHVVISRDVESFSPDRAHVVVKIGRHKHFPDKFMLPFSGRKNNFGYLYEFIADVTQDTSKPLVFKLRLHCDNDDGCLTQPEAFKSSNISCQKFKEMTLHLDIWNQDKEGRYHVYHLLYRQENDLPSGMLLFFPKLDRLKADIFPTNTSTTTTAAEFYLKDLLMMNKWFKGPDLEVLWIMAVKEYIFCPCLAFLRQKLTKARTVLAAIFLLKLTLGHGIDVTDEERDVLAKGMLLWPEQDVVGTGSQCVDVQILRENFPPISMGGKLIASDGGMATELLECLINKLPDSSPAWLYVVPIVHQLTGMKPTTTNYLHSIWWGLIGLSNKCQNFKRMKAWDMQTIEQVFADLEPLFTVDLLLERTFVAALSLNELSRMVKQHDFSVEIITAAVYKHLESTSDLSGSFDVLQTLLESVMDVMKTVSKSNAEGQQSDGENRMYTGICSLMDIIVRELVNKEDGKELNATIGCAVALQLTVLHHILKLRDFPPAFQRAFFDSTEVWLTKMKLELECVKVVDKCLLQTAALDSQLQRDFQKMVLETFRGKLDNLRKSNGAATAIRFCTECAKRFTTLRDLCDGFINEWLEDALKEGSVTIDAYLCDAMSKIYERQMKKVEDKEDKMLEMVFLWVPMRAFFAKLDSLKTVYGLADIIMEDLEKCVEFLDNLIEQLNSGELTVHEAVWLKEHEAQFKEVVHIAYPHQEETLVCLLTQRIKEVSMLQLSLKYLDHCQTECERIFSADDEDVSMNSLTEAQNVQEKKLSEVCCIPDGLVHSMEAYNPAVTLPGVPDSFLQCVGNLADVSVRLKSVYFREILKKTRRPGGQPQAWLDLVASALKGASDKWNRLRDAIIDGQVTLTEATGFLICLEKAGHLDEILRDELTIMAVSLKKVSSSNEWLQERRDQLEVLRNLEWLRDRADNIMALHNKLRHRCMPATCKQQLQQHWFSDTCAQDLESVRKLTRETPLKKLTTPECKVTLERIRGLTEEQMNYLKALAADDCVDFIEWIVKTLAEGLQDLTVFVDLALIYLGNGNDKMQKVRNLQAVVMGYSPLLFSKAGESVTFFGRCLEVLEGIKQDPQLPHNCTRAVGDLVLFKEIYQFHGCTDEETMNRVQGIAERGILRMGKVQASQDQQQDLELHDVICLDVPRQWREEAAASTAGEEGQAEDRSAEEQGKAEKLDLNDRDVFYSYRDLMDLQSRLVLLVSNQQGTEVQLFKKVMDSILRLAETYLKLCRAGCSLFFDFNVKFKFSESSEVMCVVEFLKDKNNDPLQLCGKRTDTTNEAIKDYIAVVADFLDDCHDQWHQFVEEKRTRHEELNAFTMDQLVFLQKQFAITESGKQSPSVFPLLNLLLPGCTHAQLQEAMKQASESEADVKDDDDEIDEEEAQARANLRFINHCMANGFTRRVAERALKETQPQERNDLDAALDLCLDIDEGEECASDADDDDDSQEVDSSVKKESAGTEHGGSALIMREKTVAEMLIGHSRQEALVLENMNHQMQQIWTEFRQSTSDSGFDYLSLRHLGLVLKFLSAKAPPGVTRKLPVDMKSGRPNFLVCPEKDVLYTVTHLYSTTRRAPLPQADEVLLCTPKTTCEQVNIFLRQAFSAKAEEQGKLHTMAFIDKLNYSVSESAEDMLQKLVSLAEGRKYQLVLICATENENSAHIAAALAKYQCPFPTAVETDHICTYLKEKFAASGLLGTLQVDPEGLCVRVVKSLRAGMGKTLYKKRQVLKLEERLKARQPIKEGTITTVTVTLYEKRVQPEDVAARLLQLLPVHQPDSPMVIHLDISYEVQDGLDIVLYQLLVLGCLTDHHGHVWHRSPSHLYLLEAMPLVEHSSSSQSTRTSIHRMFDVLPKVTCWSPRHVYEGKLRHQKDTKFDPGFDLIECYSNKFQRPCHYLKAHDDVSQPGVVRLSDSRKDTPDPSIYLGTLLKHCGLEDPSWSELYHFTCFLNNQLQDYEQSDFCKILASDVRGFKVFVLRAIIRMSRDFATRSLVITEEELPVFESQAARSDPIRGFQMRRKWDTSPHPYILFNSDRASMSFIGFNVDEKTYDLLGKDGTVLERNIMTRQLYNNLGANGVTLKDVFDSTSREERLCQLYRAMGLTEEEIRDENGHVIDVDDTYELTTDNVKKILAIYMRFRCNIPVVVMGDTGCGKTRLVQFMCALQAPKEKGDSTMVLMKIHGGTTAHDIQEAVRSAQQQADSRKKLAHRPIFTVLFFDEANTTEAIGAIKEVMCDGAMNGQPVSLNHNLKFVAACNPYRKHSDAVIRRLESAGLGYHVRAEKTEDKLGSVPLRQLVYRVRPLPQSMLTLVWDFGQLNTDVERLYINMMIARYIRKGDLWAFSEEDQAQICEVLVQSHAFMRKEKDECIFVSLRDAERALRTVSWFLKQFMLLNAINRNLAQKAPSTLLKVALVLALGVCYRAGLRSKQKFDQYIVQQVPDFLDHAEQFGLILEECQMMLMTVLTSSGDTGPRIAPNEALIDNMFMMVVCMALRIPLFLVGKPGSSKSLAKAIIYSFMQRMSPRDKDTLFKLVPQAQMVSFQCSPLTTSEGILSTFQQCAELQAERENFVAVAVLEEIGLAEDSPNMPLKILHPLLDDGVDIEQPGENGGKKTEKVAFLGISNWALDPAKMNRGILVQRDVPSEEELVKTAKGICGYRRDKSEDISELLVDIEVLRVLAKTYMDIFENPAMNREFFGLRDFYSVVKMVCAMVVRYQRQLTRSEMLIAIQRNFGGLETVEPAKPFNPVEVFDSVAQKAGLFTDKEDGEETQPLPIRHALEGENFGGECRYLLLLTENFGALHILTDTLLKDKTIEVIFGSSFPKDQEYMQVCNNIKQVRFCMEAGQTVVLLNMENMYESLYEAMNQYYQTLNETKFVDLCLGSQRAKCKVHEDFRMIVVAEKKTVYEKFPIPLINRLEKHFLKPLDILSESQKHLEGKLVQWARELSASVDSSLWDMFQGFHPDTASSVVLASASQGMEECQASLVWCATPDAIIRSRQDDLYRVYFHYQQHESMAQYLHSQLQSDINTCLLAQVTTHSKMLTNEDIAEIETHLPDFSCCLESLQAFRTQQEFDTLLSQFVYNLDGTMTKKRVLFLQCERGNRNHTLLQCAQYRVQKLWTDKALTNRHVIFIVQLPRVTTVPFTGFIGGTWHCAHLDYLTSAKHVPPMTALLASTPAQILSVTHPSRTSVEGFHEFEDEVSVEEERDEGADNHGALMRYLLVVSTQTAMGRIQDGNNQNARSMALIRILLHCLKESANGAFLRGMWRMVASLLAERESRQVKEDKDERSWLADDAANPGLIRALGTFRQAWIQCLQRRLTPIYAGVVAYLDTNHNMDLLEHDTNPEWLQQFWLSILNDPHLCQVQYSDLLSMSGKYSTELKEFSCRSTLPTKNFRPCALPYSWIILDMVALALQQASQSSESDTVTGAVDILRESSLAKHLDSAVSCEEEASEFVTRYCQDLLQISIHTKPEQTELLAKCLDRALQQEGVTYIPREMTMTLVRVHHVFLITKSRLLALLDLVAIGQDISEPDEMSRVIADLKAEPARNPPELVEDVIQMERVLQKMRLKAGQLNSVDNCTAWLDLHSKVAPVITRFMKRVSQVSAGQTGGTSTGPVLRFGSWCQETLQKLKCLWTAVSTVKLFMDFVSPLDEDKHRVKVDFQNINYMFLNTRLGNTADMKRPQADGKLSLHKVDEFLARCERKVISSALGDVQSCSGCRTALTATPVHLSCSHRVCQACFQNEVRLNWSCPKCKKAVSQEMRLDTGHSEKVEQLLRFQHQIDAFLLALTSQLCLAGDDPPDPVVVKHVFSYVTHHALGVVTFNSPYLQLYKGQMDRTSLFRALLLRTLLRSCEEQVKELIAEELQQNQGTAAELGLQVVYCTEIGDHEREMLEAADSNKSDHRQAQATHLQHLLTQLLSAQQLPALSAQESPTLPSLQAYGHLRYALAACAALLRTDIIQAKEPVTVDDWLSQLLQQVHDVCCLDEADRPRKFLIKQLCREYGEEAFAILKQRSQQLPGLQWIVHNVRCEIAPDRYVVCGDGYETLQADICRGQTKEMVQNLAKLQCNNKMKEYLLCLALHREVVYNNILQSQRTVVKEMLGLVEYKAICLTELANLDFEDFIPRLLNNQLGVEGSVLCASPDQGVATQSLLSVLIHFWLALRAGEESGDMLSPFLTLITHPEKMKDSFLPTMPQDDIDLCSLAAGNEYAVVYRCPNNHPYLIGECGRPWEVSICPSCGEPIGGQLHKAYDGNTRASGRDLTQPGHLLGAASTRKEDAERVRIMRPTECVVVRFLTHATLLVSACQPEQAEEVAEMVQPEIDVSEVISFFWQHLLLDIRILQTALGTCVDNVYILLHHLCHTFASRQPGQSAVLLSTKQERETWEKDFVESFIRPVMERVYLVIQEKGAEVLKLSQRSGQNFLTEILYEVGEMPVTPTTPTMPTTPPAADEGVVEGGVLPAAALWKYHSLITEDSFFRQFQLHNQMRELKGLGAAHPVLKLFNAERPILQALHCLPDILQLQHRVLQHLRQRLQEKDAETLAVKDVAAGDRDLSLQADLQKLVTVFSCAWDIVKDQLPAYETYAQSTAHVNPVTRRSLSMAFINICLPQEFYGAKVDESSRVGMLLPHTRGSGRCAYILIHFLLHHHNRILKDYCSIPSVRQQYGELRQVPVHAITGRHLLGYSPSALLPLVLDHCSYTCVPGVSATDDTNQSVFASDTDLRCDFHGFELQLNNILFLRKSSVQMISRENYEIFEIETMVYTDIRTARELLRRLRYKKRTSQVPLSLTLRQRICEDLRDKLPEVSQSIENLNTTLPFLLQLSKDNAGEQQLSAFMADSLRMANTILSPRAQQHCRVKHVQSLWLTLCNLKAVLLTTNNYKEEAFGGEGENIRVPLTQAQKTDLKAAMDTAVPGQLELLQSHLFDAILLQLLQEDPGMARPDTYSIQMRLTYNVEDITYYSEPPEEIQSQKLTTEIVDNLLPCPIMANQAISLWLAIVQHLHQLQ